MTTMPDDRLYNLLPEYYRAADAAAGGVLRALLQVIGAQVDVVQADIDQLYRNWFIETCQDWAVPYLGDLVGYQPAQHGGGSASRPRPRASGSTGPAKRRADVAPRTVATRRRKGTLAVLVELAADVAGWPARAVEFRTLLAQTQSVNHVRLDRGRRPTCAMATCSTAADGPFDGLAHVADVRRVSSARRPGTVRHPRRRAVRVAAGLLLHHPRARLSAGTRSAQPVLVQHPGQRHPADDAPRRTGLLTEPGRGRRPGLDPPPARSRPACTTTTGRQPACASGGTSPAARRSPSPTSSRPT